MPTNKIEFNNISFCEVHGSFKMAYKQILNFDKQYSNTFIQYIHEQLGYTIDKIQSNEELNVELRK